MQNLLSISKIALVHCEYNILLLYSVFVDDQVKYQIFVVWQKQCETLFVLIVGIYLNTAEVSSSPHHATLIVTDRQGDWYFASQRNLGIWQIRIA